MPDDPALRIFPDEFVPNVQSSKVYQRWAKSSPGDRGRWEAFRDALLAGQEPGVPSMSTSFGRALVAAGKEHMSISQLVGAVTNPYPPLPTPLPSLPPQEPITITQGGTYTGHWVSDSTVSAVTIATTEPVVITRSIIRNTSNSGLLIGISADCNLIVERTYLYGGQGRIINRDGFNRIEVRNCTIEKTGGIRPVHGNPGSTLVITRNRVTNIQGPSMGAQGLRQFVQLGECQNPAIEISWNEIVNEFGLSEVEDVISVFKSAHARIHNNYIEGGYPFTNTQASSANGITVEVGDALVYTSFDNQVYDNQIVGNAGGIGLVGGHDNSATNNRIIQDGKLPDGSTFLAANLGMAIWDIAQVGPTQFYNNTARGNVVGYVNRDGNRNDYWFPAAPSELQYNTSFVNSPANESSDPVTSADEANERTLWTQKLAANAITVGAY